MRGGRGGGRIRKHCRPGPWMQAGAQLPPFTAANSAACGTERGRVSSGFVLYFRYVPQNTLLLTHTSGRTACECPTFLACNAACTAVGITSSTTNRFIPSPVEPSRSFVVLHEEVNRSLQLNASESLAHAPEEDNPQAPHRRRGRWRAGTWRRPTQS